MRFHRTFSTLTAAALALTFLLSGTSAWAVQNDAVKVDKEKCALMIRHGQDALDRGRYQDAKYYFQSAVQADPQNPKPWNWYDLATFYAAAEEMKNTGKYMVRPAEPTQPPAAISSSPTMEGSTTAQSQPPAAPPKPKKPKGFTIADDEGC